MTDEQRARDEAAVRLRIYHGWLVEEVDRHEPDCGLIPEVDLRTLPGFSDLIAAARREGAEQAWFEGYNAGSDAGLGRVTFGSTDNPYRDAIARGDQPMPNDRQTEPSLGGEGAADQTELATKTCWMCGAPSGQNHAKACGVDGPMP